MKPETADTNRTTGELLAGPPPGERAENAPPRLLSLDVYRGIVMFSLFCAGFGLSKVAANFPNSGFWEWVKYSTTHPAWLSQTKVIGFSLWDMIQPAFMFMVGVSMPYSYAKREKLGQSHNKRLAHAWIRALILVLLGVFLASNVRTGTNWRFTNVLAQIGLGYGFLFFLLGKSFRTQLIVGVTVLVGYYFLMLPWGFENRTSMPQKFDLWFLNLFRPENDFTGHDYATLNFVPAFVTMLMGLMCGDLLRNRELSEGVKLKRLFVSGAILLVAGVVFGFVCPIVKKLWTPSWALFCGAYVIWLLAILYWVIDVGIGQRTSSAGRSAHAQTAGQAHSRRFDWKKCWIYFFVVVGVNSIAAYMMGQLMKPWTREKIWKTHLPEKFWEFTGKWTPFWEATLVGLFFWLILWWMYRNRVFVRV
ncbi:MAG: hypothetical protein HKN23_12380 [Verrucomicrobiales bacterium]|nr:hypothetical protein [Verrucomicrobiales bacterium]